jgi:adhesin/invasin
MKFTSLGRVLLPAIVLLASCGRDSSSSPTAAEETIAAGAVDAVSVVSGNGQLGDAGAPLGDPVVLRVTENGRPVAGAPIRWELPQGAGRLADALAVTDADGYARATWILGESAPTATLTVSVGSISTNLIAARRSGLQRADLKLVRVSGNAQSGPAGGALGQPLVVRVVSGREGPLAGVKVRWEAEDGGRVSIDSAFSAADGTVTARWTLGSATGTQLLSASTAGAQPITFAANAIPATGEPVTLTIVSGNGQGARVNAALPAQLVVRATNAAGTPLYGVQVSWRVQSGGGSITPAAITTDGSGLAWARWTMGPSAGQGTAVATAPGGAAATFTATALGDNRVAALVKVLGDGQVECPGCGLREQIRVMAVDALGNPVPNAPVTWTPSHGGSLSVQSNVTDATGTAFASWNLGTPVAVQTLTATSGSVSTDFTATASRGGDGVVARIQISVGRNGLDLGESGSARATAVDAAGRAVPNAVISWSVEEPGIIEFTVDPTTTGRVTFRALETYGQVRLTASAGGQSNGFNVYVRRPGNGGGGGSADVVPVTPAVQP